LVQNQISKGRLARRHPRRVGGLSQDFAHIEEGSESRVGGFDRLDAERIKLGRRGIELDDRRRIVAGERVVR
jgi:hypothetical protein